MKGVCMRKIFILTLVIVFGLASVSFAGVEEGKSEIGGNITRQDIDGIVLTMVNLNYGYFMTDEVQLTGNMMLMKAEGYKALALEGQGRYHFILGEEYVPYVGGLIGTFNIDGDGFSESAMSYGFMGGVKYFVSEDTSFNLEYNYKNVMYDSGDISITTTTAGMAIYF